MFTIFAPKKALSTVFYKLPVLQSEIEKLSSNLTTYINQGKEDESEEYHKGLIRDFLINTWYGQNYSVNTNGREDLVIYNGTGTESKPAVIIEAKSPTNTSEMFSVKNPNCKALQECVYYFMQESLKFGNNEIKHIIITDYDDFYIFDAKDFSRFFLAKTNPILDQFNKFEAKQLSDTKTSYFYENCAKPAINRWIENENVTVTHFSPMDFMDKTGDALIPLYKILSPEHLLNKPFANDSNSLDKNFYAELLHIIGLEEVKDGSKKIIQRKAEKDRNRASLLESAIYQLEDRITSQNKLFEISLNLVITWLNRLLFLKLVESQQLLYQKGNTDYRFLTLEKIDSFDELNILFFKVLGRKVEERDKETHEKYRNVPYLNSSLFEISEEERDYLQIYAIQNKPLALYGKTVLKDEKGKRLSGEMDNLAYIFKFLDAYNFSSEGTGGITQNSKTLINASVLGLIFEKINGYKDGSFFTPGFITEYMAKESVERAVIQKFNSIKGWKCQNLDDLADEIEDRAEANKIINSIKICDPAVGSGHFLVSVLNRLLFIKSYLNILLDKDGKRIKNSDWELRLESDEISVLDEDGNPFTYTTNAERQRVQETLFNEKRMIIENCLFGVDINPASVYICRLRLWIELLKNAYYTSESGFSQLETLPNIDINIKCGNSLISRFPVNIGRSLIKEADNEVKTAAFRQRIKEYRGAVANYKSENNKENKQKVEHLINSIKDKIKSDGQLDLFDVELNKKAEEAGVFKGSFEWMLEFPEALDDDGCFVGFDVVIGNPPYGIFNKKQNQKVSLTTEANSIELIRKRFAEIDEGMINAAKVFYSLGFRLLSQKGFLCMIIPFGILSDTSSIKLRKSIFESHSFLKIDAFPERDSTTRRVFEDAKMSTAIILSSNEKLDCVFKVGVSFEKKIPSKYAIFTFTDIIAYSPKMMQIPMCSRKTFDLLMKFRMRTDLTKFKDVAPCLTGELDMTQGKKYLTNDESKPMLVKGVQIARYIFKTINEDISQGQIEYVNYDEFFNNCSLDKREQVKHERIVMQGLSGINETRRLKATLVPANLILANSSNFLKHQTEYQPLLLLALFNSELLNFIFKATSTSSNVNGYEVDALPLPKLTQENAKNREKIIALAGEILRIKKENPNEDTNVFEKEIDLLVYKLYGLSYEEVLIVNPETTITKEEYESK